MQFKITYIFKYIYTLNEERALIKLNNIMKIFKCNIIIKLLKNVILLSPKF